MEEHTRENMDQAENLGTQHYYGPIAQQFGMIALPKVADRPRRYPVAILIHGGFWRSAFDLTLMDALAQDLVQRGIAVWNIEYRRVGDEGGGWPGTFHDVAAATDFLTTLASEYPLDLQRVVAIGHSAGGQLALWLAARQQLPTSSPLFTTPQPLQLAGVVSLAGVNDLALAWQLHLGQNAVQALLGGAPATFPDRYACTSPAQLLPLHIPQILVHGSADTRVPLTLSQLYAQKARQTGDPITLIELPGADHFVVIDPHSNAWQQTIRALLPLLTSIP